MDGHLGGAVDADPGGDLTAQLGHPQILDDEGIDAHPGGLGDEVGYFLIFPVGDQGIQGQVDSHAPDMAVFQGLAQGLQGEVFGALPGIEGADAQVDGIGAILNRRAQRFHGAGGG